jgi:hypothetical protein
MAVEAEIMNSVTILGRNMSVEYRVGAGGGALDQAVLFAGLQEAVALINSVGTWTSHERQALSTMRKIVFFSGEIVVNTWKLTRSGCDEDDAIFYWEAGEFMANTDADVRASTFFHDCWHVIQFRRDGGFAQTNEIRVVREVDAITRQIEAARKLGCVDHEIAHLQQYLDEHALIVARLAEGIGRMDHAQPIARA